MIFNYLNNMDGSDSLLNANNVMENKDLKYSKNAQRMSKNNLSLKSRIEKCREILKKVENSDSNGILNEIFNCFPDKIQNQNDIRNKPYLGVRKGFNKKTSDNKKMNFLRNMRKTINDIVNDDEINSRPSIDDIIDCFSHEKPNSTIWNYNNGYCKTAIDKL